jgi:subtilase family serine protease
MKPKTLAATAIASATLAVAVSIGSAAAQPMTPLDAGKQVQFSVVLPMRNTAAMQSLLVAQRTPGSPNYHKWLAPAEIAAQFGPSRETLAQVEAILTAAGFQVTATHIRSIDVTGTAGQAKHLLGANLQSIRTSNGGTRMVSANRPSIPASLAALGVQVLHFSNVRERHLTSQVLATSVPDSRAGAYGGYYYNDLKQAYDYPSYASLTGTGAHVAIVMENTAKTTDVQAMFAAQGFLTTTHARAYPTFTQLYTQDCYVTLPSAGLYRSSTGLVGGCKFNTSAGSVEASLDTQMVMGAAPGAAVALVTIPDLSDASILDAYTDIIDSNAFDIVSNSFGGCELDYTPAYNEGHDYTPTLAYYSSLFQLGSMEGITWIFSSGDEGGLGCPSLSYMADQTGLLHQPGVWVAGVETPAADPNVTAVGGGNLQTTFTSGSLNSAYIGENGAGDPEVPYDPYGFGANVSGGYWGATGGVSQLFALPSYQAALVSATGRAVPDIGMQVGGCPGGLSVTPCPAAGTGGRSYVATYVNGRAEGLIGTSVSAPEFAGALALYVQFTHSRQGNINPMLYTALAQQIAAGGPKAPAALRSYHMSITGYDGYYHELPNTGYNYIYGNGSPDIRVLFGMNALPAAGLPKSASNP